MRIETTTRRANFWLFAGLVVFAIVLCATVLLWMRARTHAQGGKVYPPVGVMLIRDSSNPPRSFRKIDILKSRFTTKVQNSPVEILPAFPLISRSQTPVLL